MQLKLGNISIFPHDINFDFMKWRKVSVGITLLLTVLSFVVIAVKGINYSIDFLGGAEVTLNFTDKSISREKVLELARSANVGDVEVTTISALGKEAAASYVMRIQREKGTDEAQTSTRADQLVKTFRTSLGEDKVQVGAITNISGKIGEEEQVRGYMAILLSFIGILIYTAFRFDSRFAPGAVICLFHDVTIALGFMTALGKPFSVSSIAAFLTIVGYSCNDTIIVYDRIRETQALDPRANLVDVVNRSLNQTMNRTVLTSATGLASLIVLMVLGGGALEDFALTMFVGIVIGTYSSIYVAAPLTLMMDDFLVKRGWRPKEPKQKAKVERDESYAPPVLLKRKPQK